jgi:glycosyltransferase involved in cell wall biosynthesis
MPLPFAPWPAATVDINEAKSNFVRGPRMLMQGELFRLKRYLERYRPYLIAREIKWCLQANLRDSLDRRVVSLKPEGASRGNVLLSFFVRPFLLKPGQLIAHDHSREWESWEIARTFLDLGYCVDVINWTNKTFVPQKHYAFFIDCCWNLQRLAPMLNEDCVKIMHIDTAHMLFHNAAEARRLLALQRRKGVSLPPRRFEMPNLAIEHADCATIMGNEFTINTFGYASKPIYRVPVIPVPTPYPWPDQKDFEACRRHFLWFSSGGMVHKGLDLVLDAFAEMPGYHLTVCGPVQKEQDFENAYYKELYQTPNISTFGWVDIKSPEFMEIVNNCLGLIYPSCSEGQSGAVVTCLHAGLIPIISYESGVDVGDFGLILQECSIKEIQSAVRQISSLSAQELKTRARKAWEYAQTHHTHEKFAQEYRKAVETIIATHGEKKCPVDIPRPSLASAPLSRLNLS